MTYLYDTIGILGIFVVVLIMHEFGHIFAYQLIRKSWPPLKIRWWGIEVGNKELCCELTLGQDYWIRVGGIMVGYFTLVSLFWMSPFIDRLFGAIMVYLWMCFLDIAAIYQILTNPDKRDWKYKEMKIVRVIE